MIIRRTNEKTAAGKSIVLMGNDAANLSKYYEDGENFVAIPLSPAELTVRYSAACKMHYTNKDGETYYSSDATTKTDVLKESGDKVLCKHTGVLWGGKGKRVDRIAIWEVKDGRAVNPGIPEKHFPIEDWEMIKKLA
jgi:hypothetical protein